MAENKKFVADTHAIIWHLAGSPKLSVEAKRRFDLADNGQAIIYLSVITPIELLYLTEKNKITPASLELFKHLVKSNPTDSYQIVDLTYSLALFLAEVPYEKIPEMPDRVIAATAIKLRVPLITCDSKMRGWEGLETVW